MGKYFNESVWKSLGAYLTLTLVKLSIENFLLLIAMSDSNLKLNQILIMLQWLYYEKKLFHINLKAVRIEINRGKLQNHQIVWESEVFLV